MKIVIAESLHPAAIHLFQEQPGWEVVTSTPQAFEQYLPEADALVASPAGKLSAALIAKAPNLKAVAVLGGAVDFIDVDAATEAGVLVMNSPGESAVSVAEHTVGLMLALARSIPQATDSVKHGKWEGKRFLGTEMRGKTLGVVGLGAIGREVVRRVRGFKMKIVAHDPYVNSQTAADLGVGLVSRDELYQQSDFITLHVALTTETMGMLNDAAFAKMKHGVRIVNCARGELIDPEALRRAIESGKVAGAALDVLQSEPPQAGEPLLALDQVLATPHIGGATEEAEESVSVRLAEHLIDYLTHGIAVNAVNVPVMTAEEYRAVAPYADLTERLGTFAAHIVTGNPKLVRIIYHGNMAPERTRLIRNAGLAGVLSRSVARKTNVVNAPQIAADRGLHFAERFERATGYADSIRLELETDAGITKVEGAIVLDHPRLLEVDGIRCEAPLGGHLLYIKTDDVPGVIGWLGSTIGKHKINISAFSFGRQSVSLKPGAPLEAISIVGTDQVVSEPVIAELLQNQALKVARWVEFQR